MLRRVKKVEYLHGYKLKLFFDNGKIKVLDLELELKKAKNLFLDLVEIRDCLLAILRKFSVMGLRYFGQMGSIFARNGYIKMLKK